MAGGLGRYVVYVGAGTAMGASTALGLAEGLHMMVPGGAILTGSAVLGVASLATFSQAGCGETRGEVTQTESWISKE